VRVLLLTLVLFHLQSPTYSVAQGTNDSLKNQIKVSFIYNFTKFITWPNANKSNNSFSICAIGGEALYSSLDHLSKVKKIKNKTILIQKNPSLDKLNACSILFIGSSESNNLKSILDKIRGLPLLTIGDTEGYKKRGVAITLCEVNRKVRFKINRRAISNAGLTVSSELLKLGIRVDSKK
jgi:uncharacterized protein DUF4154